MRIRQLDRLLTKCTQAPDGCWVWIGATSKQYGVLRVDGQNVQAHRLSYEIHVGPIPNGLEIDHLCKNKACINPAHLEPVTHQINMTRADAGKKTGARHRGKTYCANGHPYNAVNTYVDARGHRACRACKAEWWRRHHAH